MFGAVNKPSRVALRLVKKTCDYLISLNHVIVTSSPHYPTTCLDFNQDSVQASLLTKHWLTSHCTAAPAVPRRPRPYPPGMDRNPSAGETLLMETDSLREI